MGAEFAEDTAPSSERALVFEAVNETLKEFYLGLSPDGMSISELLYRHRLCPPPSIRHWSPDHRVSYRFVEAPSRPREGAAFVRSLALTIAAIGWSALTDEVALCEGAGWSKAHFQ